MKPLFHIFQLLFYVSSNFFGDVRALLHTRWVFSSRDFSSCNFSNDWRARCFDIAAKFFEQHVHLHDFVSTKLREKLLIEAVGFSFHKHFAFPEGVTLEHLTETLAKVFFASFFIGRKYYFSNSFKLSFSWLDLF